MNVKQLERCEICDEPTGNAGLDDDSQRCEVCGYIICDECSRLKYGRIVCKICEVGV